MIYDTAGFCGRRRRDVDSEVAVSALRTAPTSRGEILTLIWGMSKSGILSAYCALIWYMACQPGHKGDSLSSLGSWVLLEDKICVPTDSVVARLSRIWLAMRLADPPRRLPSERRETYSELSMGRLRAVKESRTNSKKSNAASESSEGDREDSCRAFCTLRTPRIAPSVVLLGIKPLPSKSASASLATTKFPTDRDDTRIVL